MKRSAVNILSLVTSLLTIFFFGESYWASRPNDAKRRMDARRISDLSEISLRVGDFAVRNGRLPSSLEEAQIASRDPSTGYLYRYRLKDQHSYELCADFDRSTGISPQFAAGHFWSHSSGMQCTTMSANKR